MPNLSLTEILTALGGTAAISIVVSSYLSKLASDRLNIKWKADADRELEHFKSEMAKNQALLTSIYTQYTNGYHHGQERRIKAIEILWTNLRFKVEFIDSIASPIYHIFSREEIQDYWTRQTVNTNFLAERQRYSNLNVERLLNDFAPYTKPVEDERPFLGEKVYQQYNYFHFFLARLSYLILIGAQGRNFIHWHDDQAIVDILRNALTPAEFNYIINEELRSYDRTKQILEIKLLESINEVISGRAASESALELVKKHDAVTRSIPIH